MAVLGEARAGPEGLVARHATKRAGRLLTLHRALYDAVLVNIKRAGRRAPVNLGVQAVAGGQGGELRAVLAELRRGHGPSGGGLDGVLGFCYSKIRPNMRPDKTDKTDSPQPSPGESS